MATLKQKIQAEQSGRAMLEKGGLPPPDAVEYGYTCIRFFWNEAKVVLIIDIDEPPDGPDAIDESAQDLNYGDQSTEESDDAIARYLPEIEDEAA
jgi:hypothetical protein